MAAPLSSDALVRVPDTLARVSSTGLIPLVGRAMAVSAGLHEPVTTPGEHLYFDGMDTTRFNYLGLIEEALLFCSSINLCVSLSARVWPADISYGCLGAQSLMRGL